MLRRLVGPGDLRTRGQGDAAGHRLDAFATGVGERVAKINATPMGRTWPVGAATEVGGIGTEAVERFRGESGGLGPVRTL